jgi:hypothetical protein
VIRIHDALLTVLVLDWREHAMGWVTAWRSWKT